MQKHQTWAFYFVSVSIRRVVNVLPRCWQSFANVVAKLCQHRGTSTNKPAVGTMQLHGLSQQGI